MNYSQRIIAFCWYLVWNKMLTVNNHFVLSSYYTYGRTHSNADSVIDAATNRTIIQYEQAVVMKLGKGYWSWFSCPVEGTAAKLISVCGTHSILVTH